MSEPVTIFYVYMLLMKNGKIYTGMTNDLDRRLQEHKDGKGSRVVRSFGVDKLIYSEPHASKSSALKREAQIKKWPRTKKLALANGEPVE